MVDKNKSVSQLEQELVNKPIPTQVYDKLTISTKETVYRLSAEDLFDKSKPGDLSKADAWTEKQTEQLVSCYKGVSGILSYVITQYGDSKILSPQDVSCLLKYMEPLDNSRENLSADIKLKCIRKLSNELTSRLTRDGISDIDGEGGKFLTRRDNLMRKVDKLKIAVFNAGQVMEEVQRVVKDLKQMQKTGANVSNPKELIKEEFRQAPLTLSKALKGITVANKAVGCTSHRSNTEINLVLDDNTVKLRKGLDRQVECIHIYLS